MPGLMDGLSPDFRPRYGAANQGYDMNAARQYPQPSTRDLAALGMIPLGAGLGMGAGLVAAGLPSIPAGVMTSAAGAGYLPGALGTLGLGGLAGGALGAASGFDTYKKMRNGMTGGGDAERQPGGFYGNMPR